MPDRAGMSPRKTTEVDSMKRAILILATALLGTTTACSSHSCDGVGDVNLFWNFQDARGAPLSCSQAGVAQMNVIVDGVDNGTFACTLTARDGSPVQGITLQGFNPASHSFELHALDASGRETYTDAFALPTDRTCNGNTVDRVLTRTVGDLTVAFRLTNANGTATEGCSSGAPTFIWYVLLDQNGQEVSSVDQNNSPTAIPCTAGGVFFQDLPFQQYTLAAIAEVNITSLGPPVTVVPLHATCTPQTFQHALPGETATVSVPASSGLCGF
jgi:hypothetical protein